MTAVIIPYNGETKQIKCSFCKSQKSATNPVIVSDSEIAANICSKCAKKFKEMIDKDDKN